MRTLAAVVALGVATGASARDLPEVFPLEVRMARPVALVFLRPAPLGPPPARRSTSVGTLWANDFRRAGPVDEDAEVLRLNLTWTERVGQGGQAWLAVPVVARGSGELDSVIDAWHRAILGWEDPVRATSPRYRSVVAREGRYAFGSAAGLGDVSGGLAVPWRGFQLQLALKLPTGHSGRLLGSGGIDVATGVERQGRVGRGWTLGGFVGLTHQGSARDLPGARRWVESLTLWAAYQPNPSDTWLLQWVSEGAAVTTGVPGVDSAARVLALGYRRRTGPRSYTEVLLIEDRDLASGQAPWLVNQGPDVSFGLRFVWR